MRRWLMVFVFAVGFASAGLAAQETPTDSAADKALDAAALSAFVDPLLAAKMELHHVPGCVLTVVKDGHVVLGKGYGYANLESKRPVDAATTLFRVASVSKLFTATAILQLHEQGRIDLKDEANEHSFEVKFPATFSQAILVEDLIMHTAGLDERYLNIATWNTQDDTPLLDHLSAGMPKRVYPPRTLTSYSNYGFGFAGHIIASSFMRPYFQYMEENVLRPLGMTSSTFKLPPERAGDVSTAYVWKDGAYAIQPDDVLYNTPAGGLYATGNDLARFMIMQLNGGTIDGFAVLKPESTALMQQQHFTNVPGVPGMCYGFFEEIHQGRRALAHDGYWNRFTSRLVLIPELKLSFFMSCNADGGAALYREVFDALMTEFFPVPESPAPVQSTSPESLQRAQQVAGVYRPTRFTRHSVTKLESLMNQEVVQANADGSITIIADDETTRYVEMSPNIYVPEKGGQPIGFRIDGQDKYYFKGILSRESVSFLETRTAQIVLVAVFALAFLSAIVLAPFGWASAPDGARRARLAAAAFGLLGLVFMGGLAFALVGMDRLAFVHEPPVPLKLLLILPLAGIPLALYLQVQQPTVFRYRYWSLPGRIHFILFSDIVLGWYVFLWYWNLAGFNY